MAIIPPQVTDSALTRILCRMLTLIGRGKVRDTYDLGNGLLLVVATDRISIYDFVLNALIRFKGSVLTAMTHFWLIESGVCQYPHHLVAWGQGIDQYLPRELRQHRELQTRALVVQQLEMFDIEAIVRGLLTGGGLKTYRENGQVCGVQLPPGLKDGSPLDPPIFTPTTKAVEGHDEHLDAATVMAQYPDIAPLVIDLYSCGATYARNRGVVIADTKFELGIRDGVLTVGDEVLTPDSSRFWDAVEVEEAMAAGRTPRSCDKQRMRDIMGAEVYEPTGQALNSNKLNPDDPEHLAWVHGLTVPDEVCEETTEIYLDIFERLTDMPLPVYRSEVMNCLG